VCSDDEYGETFRQWFGFQAEEMGNEVSFISLIDHITTVEDAFRVYYEKADGEGKSTNTVFFTPSSDSDFIALDRILDRYDADTTSEYYRYGRPSIFCGDRCVSDLARTTVTGYYEGVEPTAAPESGFIPAYRSKFNGEEPLGGEPQLFDAIYMLYYALTLEEYNKSQAGDKSAVSGSDLNDAIVELVDGRETFDCSWLEDDTRFVFTALRSGMHPDLSGVSSDWTFDSRYHSAVTTTAYRYWKLYNGKYVTLGYITGSGTDRTISNLGRWEMQATKAQTFTDADAGITYQPLRDRYAVLVAASCGWENYRHQADVLAMYQMLKRHGYDDEHIILIMADDIAYNENNLYPGEVRVEPGGDNLYKDVVIDYRLGNLAEGDLLDIMTGRKSDRLTAVLPSDGARDNVLFFWSGHGNQDKLYVGDGEISAATVQQMLSGMRQLGKYRKMMMVVEACFAGSIAEKCIGIPGVACLTAANAEETSKADVIDPEMNIYLSNGFTRSFQTLIDDDSDTSLRDLYYYVAAHTVGSHARFYNIENYGNVFTERMSEFLPQ